MVAYFWRLRKPTCIVLIPKQSSEAWQCNTVTSPTWSQHFLCPTRHQDCAPTLLLAIRHIESTKPQMREHLTRLPEAPQDRESGQCQTHPWKPSCQAQRVRLYRETICLVLDKDHVEFSVIRQIHLWTSLERESESTRQTKLSPVGAVTREGVKYEETYLIQRLRPQKCTECGSGRQLGKAKFPPPKAYN
jgi:hypothetical protein